MTGASVASPEWVAEDEVGLIDEAWPYFALIVAWVATLGSLYFSEVRGFTPCTLCWYQRILMYPLALIMVVGLLRRSADLPYYVLVLSVPGAVVATYHVLLQKTSWFDSASTCKVGVPCSLQYINWFGFVSIPVLSLTAFLLITLAMSASRRDAVRTWARPDGSPARFVAAALVGVWAFFALVYVFVG